MLVLGLISGTSADGIDAALVEISGRPPRLRTRLEGFLCVPYPSPVRRELLHIAAGDPVPVSEVARLNVLLGELFADAALAACRRFRISPRRVDLVGSHGQTIYHQGAPALYLGLGQIRATLQIAEPAVIAARTGIPVIADFRPADLALGGHGAPLVPFVDFLLYRHPRRGRIALNIGGIANLTAIPAGAHPHAVLAFDTGPGNMVIDALVERFTRGRQRYDRDARLATRGVPDFDIMNTLLKDPFFRKRPPKSAGREEFGPDFVARLLALGRRRHSPEDFILTATLLSSAAIVKAVRRWVLPRMRVDDLIVSGGGAHNPILMESLKAALPGVIFHPAREFGVPEDAKEAFAFAVLAYESFHRRPANLPSATGARRPTILGKLSLP